jgi:phytoene dehydrogenase-like protein
VPSNGQLNEKYIRRTANLVGGDIGGGVMDIRQFLVRPTWKHYATSAKDIYICSSSTPPGGGVHGMCGYHAAKMALSRLKLSYAIEKASASAAGKPNL